MRPISFPPDTGPCVGTGGGLAKSGKEIQDSKAAHCIFTPFLRCKWFSWLSARAQAAHARLRSRRHAFQKDANISRASPAIQSVLEFRKNFPITRRQQAFP